MRHGGRLWPESSLISLSHSVQRHVLAETRSGIGSDRSNRYALNAPTSPMGHPFPLRSLRPRGRLPSPQRRKPARLIARCGAPLPETLATGPTPSKPPAVGLKATRKVATVTELPGHC
jgi:hypothetical protein